MVSQKKLEANRRNAAKSTGPKTPRGKEKSSRNSLKHGLLSQRTPVLPFEDEFEYRTVSDAFMLDLAPVGIVQREVVTRIVQINWKLRRIPAMEAALLEHAFRDIAEGFQRGKECGDYDDDAVIEPATAAKVIATQFAVNGDRPYERLEMYGMRLQRSFISACRELAKLKKETTGEELPVMNQVLYMNEDEVRMRRKLEEMERAEASSPSPGMPGEGRVRASQEEHLNSSEPNSECPHPNPLPAYREREQEGASASATVDRPNEPTAGANSWPGQSLPPVKATANPIANAVAKTVGSLPPKDWPWN